MSKLGKENLLLLEFLVEEVNLKTATRCCCSEPNEEYCVSYSFLDNLNLEVCEHDFSPVSKFGCGNDRNKIGKSCLFSLTPAQAQTALESFDLNVEVAKKPSSSEKTVIGSCQVPAANLLTTLLQSQEENPPPAVLQDSFTLTDSSGSDVGTVNIYVKMTYYGKMIVTQFQINLKDKTVLFIDKEGQSLYCYKKSRRKTKKAEDQNQGSNLDKSVQKNILVGPAPCFQTNVVPYSPSPFCPIQPCFPNNCMVQNQNYFPNFLETAQNQIYVSPNYQTRSPFQAKVNLCGVPYSPNPICPKLPCFPNGSVKPRPPVAQNYFPNFLNFYARMQRQIPVGPNCLIQSRFQTNVNLSGLPYSPNPICPTQPCFPKGPVSQKKTPCKISSLAIQPCKC